VLAFLLPATGAQAATIETASSGGTPAATAPANPATTFANGLTSTVAGVAGVVTGTATNVQHGVSGEVGAVPGLAPAESRAAGDVSSALSPVANATLPVAAGVAGSTANGLLPAPAGNAFYTPPSPLPPGSPGDVIWYREIAPAAASLPAATVYQVLYRSADAQGKAIAVSGTVFVPKAAWTGKGARPLVAYATGTQGWGPQCAPSREIASGGFDEQFAVSALLARGFAVAVTDEPGGGINGAQQQYTVGRAEGHAVLDSLRAALRLPGTGLSASAPVAVEGYSQGGAAAGWAAQLHPGYAPELNLKGVALGGTPANLQAVAENIDGTAFFGFLMGAASGFGAAYPSLNLDGYLNAEGKKAFAELDTMCQTQALATFAGQRIETYTKSGTNPMGNAAWSKILDANDLGTMAPDVPVMQVHGLTDEVIPYRTEAGLHSQWCAMGVTDDLVSLPTEHVTTGIDDQAVVVPWLAERLAGDSPAPDNCP
jgi:pimeloyl-ACP methyl ester carboxylesterase